MYGLKKNPTHLSRVDEIIIIFEKNTGMEYCCVSRRGAGCINRGAGYWTGCLTIDRDVSSGNVERAYFIRASCADGGNLPEHMDLCKCSGMPRLLPSQRRGRMRSGTGLFLLVHSECFGH